MRSAAGLAPVPPLLLAALAGCAALFNIANLVPVWKFDGGQVLRQICGEPAAAGAGVVPACCRRFLAVGYCAGVPLACSCSRRRGVRDPQPAHRRRRRQAAPRAEADRRASTGFAIGAALLAVFAIHGFGVLWAAPD